MKLLNEWKESFLHLLFPNLCAGCGNDLVNKGSTLCLRCIGSLPATGFASFSGNPIEKKFWGRMEVNAATAEYYFVRHSIIQYLMHTLKYKGDKDLGLQLGRFMGASLKASGRFGADGLIPLPLFPSREKKRGYNQADLLCRRISETSGIPVLNDVVYRSEETSTQTQMSRVLRWQNMQGKFVVKGLNKIKGQRLILVDDVITTGATLEACGEVLLNGGCRLSIAALCYADH